jgi:hypothetical protein
VAIPGVKQVADETLPAFGNAESSHPQDAGVHTSVIILCSEISVFLHLHEPFRYFCWGCETAICTPHIWDS